MSISSKKKVTFVFRLSLVSVMALSVFAEAKSAPKKATAKAAKTVTFTFNPAPKGTIMSTRTRIKTNQGTTKRNEGKMVVPFEIKSSKTGYIVESVIKSFTATVDGKKFNDPMISGMVGLKTQLHIDKDAKATHMTGLESLKKKMAQILKQVSTEMRIQIDPKIAQMTTGAKDISAWNLRYYQFAGEELEMGVPMVRDDSLPHPLGGNTKAVHTVVINPSSSCPTKPCVLIEHVTKTDPKSMATVMDRAMTRIAGSVKKMAPNDKKPPKFKFGASKMVMTHKILMDPSTMTIYKIDFLRDLDMDMGEFGHTIMKETHDDRYVYP